MNNINQLHADYLKAKDACSQESLKIQEKTNELNGVKQNISILDDRLTEVNRLLSNAKKGIGKTLSSDEFISLRKESNDGEHTLVGLRDFLNIQNNTLTCMKNDRGCRSQLKHTKQKITEYLTDQAVNQLIKAEPGKFKDLMHTLLAQSDLRLDNAQNYEILYKQIGQKLFNQVFTNEENSMLELPSLSQAMVERDTLIEKLA